MYILLIWWLQVFTERNSFIKNALQDQLLKGETGKLIDTSFSATKNVWLTVLQLLTESAYQNYIISLLYFHLCVDAVKPTAILKMEYMIIWYLKKWLHLPWGAERNYPEICCPSVFYVSKLSLL